MKKEVFFFVKVDAFCSNQYSEYTAIAIASGTYSRE